MKLTTGTTCSLFALLFLCLGAGAAKAQRVQDSTVLPYLVQEVCVDQTGAVLLIDPYFCSKNDTLRQLQIGHVALSQAQPGSTR